MNMKKLIAESEFDNLEELAKKWKKPDEASSRTLVDSHVHQTNRSIEHMSSIKKEKQNIAANQIEPRANLKKKPIVQESKKDDLIELDYKRMLEKEKKSHTPHIIDEDTEHFKVRLEHLLNVFKTDAVSEFMSMKRSMLDEQKDQVRADTEKYLRMYEEKHKQLVQTRQNLLSVSKDCEIKSVRCEEMAKYIAKQKEKTRVVRYLANPFNMMIRYKQYRKIKQFKINQADRNNKRRLLNKSINGWLKIYRQQSKLRMKEEEQKRVESEMNEITSKYQKEILTLRQKLQQSNAKVEDFERNKNVLQENLKKAFMRGVCAMNFEAMSALQGQKGEDFMKFQEFQESKVEEIMNNSSVSFGKKQQTPVLQNKSVVIFNQPKIESKDHKWRQAPIMTTDQHQLEEIHPLTVIPESIVEDEGKVIRVVNGKSTTVNTKTNSNVSSANNLKKSSIGNKTGAQMVSTRKK